MNFIEENEISKFYIVDGESFNKDTKGIWLDNFFAEENNLKIGDTLKVKYDGYVFEEKIDNCYNYEQSCKKTKITNRNIKSIRI